MKRIVFLTGAGFTQGSDFAGISTAALTKLLLKDKKFIYSDVSFGKFISRTLCEYYKSGPVINGHNSSLHTHINFEVIIHFIQKAYSYLHSIYTPRADWRSLEPAFTVLHPRFLSGLVEYHCSYFPLPEKIGYHYLLQLTHENFINIICNSLKKFNLSSDNIGMNCLMNFIDRKLDDSNYYKRFYTLNYDDWIARHKGYFDGFVDAKLKIGNNLSIHGNKNCHYNLHGSIWSDNVSEKFEVNKLDSVFQYSGSVSHDMSMLREPVLKSPIIVGLNKLVLSSFAPFNIFQNELIQDLSRSNLLIIIGYSFGDDNINNILKTYSGKVIVVSYDKFFDTFTSTHEYDKIGAHKYSLSELFNKIPPMTDDYFNQGQGELKNGYILSKNKNMALWFRGIGDAFYDSFDSIVDDLNIQL